MKRQEAKDEEGEAYWELNGNYDKTDDSEEIETRFIRRCRKITDADCVGYVPAAP